MKSIILAALLLSATAAHATDPTSEFLCSAQCVYVDTNAEYIDLGSAVEGWSTYAMSEAFTDILAHCQSPRVLVLSAAGSRKIINSVTDDESVSVSVNLLYGRRIRSVDYSRSSYISVYTEDDFQFDLQFANAMNACKESPVHPDQGRRYSGSHPIGG